VEQINWHSFFFLFFALVACCSAVAVVVSGNIVRMAFYLVISLGAVAGLFFLAGADFLGALQLMVYVGGTMVLLVFGVMLTAQGPMVSMKTGGGQWVLAVIVGGALLGVLLKSTFGMKQWWTGLSSAEQAAAAENTATPLGLALLGVRVDRSAAQQAGPAPEKPPHGGLSGYLLPFEIVSVHLLVVLIGAAYLARAKRRAGGDTGERPVLKVMVED